MSAERYSCVVCQIFTAAPPFAMGMFDRYCSAATLLRFPALYKSSQNSELFNVKVRLHSCIMSPCQHALITSYFLLLFYNFLGWLEVSLSFSKAKLWDVWRKRFITGQTPSYCPTNSVKALKCTKQNINHPFNGLLSRTVWVSQYKKNIHSLTPVTVVVIHHFKSTFLYP